MIIRYVEPVRGDELAPQLPQSRKMGIIPAMPIPTAEILQQLAQVPLFRDLAEADLSAIYQAGIPRQLGKDEFIFLQGDPASHFYVVTGGHARLTQLTPDGQQVIMRVIGAWQICGIVAFLGDETYPLSAQAVEGCQVLGWRTQELRKWAARHPVIAFNAMQWMAGHIKDTQERLSQMATERVERRLARALLRLAQQMGKRVPGGVLIDFPLSRQDLAEMSGTTLYTVSRLLSQWERDGLVDAGRERVLVRHPHGLVLIAEDIPPA